MSQDSQPDRPAPNSMSYWGLFCAMALLLGLPAIALTAGQNLSAGVQLTILILAIALGGVIALVSIFFGMVLPSARSGGFKYVCLLSCLATILGLPWLLLSHGNLAEWMQVVGIILAVLAGSAMLLVTVFFGLVIPHRQERGRKGAACFGENFMGAAGDAFKVKVEVKETPDGLKPGQAAPGAGEGIHLQDGKDEVHVDEEGVRVKDGKKTIHIDRHGVRVEDTKA